jgi:hypothetical protein
MAETRFCPSCGGATESTDRFCRSCGHPVDGDGTPSTAAEPERPARQRRRIVWIAPALVLVAAAAAVVVVAMAGAFSSGEGDATSRERARLASQRAALRRPFDDLMASRDEFFAQERRYLSAMSDAQGVIRSYRRAERDYKSETKSIDDEFADEFDQCFRTALPCPSPDYPDLPKVPSFEEQTAKLRRVAQRLSDLGAALASIQPPRQLLVLHTQLQASVSSQIDEAEHNADVLDEAAEPAEGEAPGSLNKGKLRTLRREGSFPAIRQMNQAARKVIDDLRLARSDYDVPGGRDLDETDHSDDI